MSSFSSPELVGHIAGMPFAEKRLRIRRVECVECGGEIVADAANPGPEVLRHNRTAAHLRACRHDRPEPRP